MRRGKYSSVKKAEIANKIKPMISKLLGLPFRVGLQFIIYHVNLGFYFQTLNLTKTKVLLNPGTGSDFVIRSLG